MPKLKQKKLFFSLKKTLRVKFFKVYLKHCIYMYPLKHQGFQEKYPSFQTNFLVTSGHQHLQRGRTIPTGNSCDKFSQVGCLIGIARRCFLSQNVGSDDSFSNGLRKISTSLDRESIELPSWKWKVLGVCIYQHLQVGVPNGSVTGCQFTIP